MNPAETKYYEDSPAGKTYNPVPPSLRITRVQNGYLAIPDEGQYSLFTPSLAMVATDAADLAVIVQQWAAAVSVPFPQVKS